MRRPPHGGSHRPGLVRPGSGYGRAPGRPGPGACARAEARHHRAWWLTVTVLVDELGRVHRTRLADAPNPGSAVRPSR